MRGSQVAPGSLAISFPSTISRSSLGRFSNSMTCPLYSVFHVVLSTQSLPACGEPSHHTSLGAVALLRAALPVALHLSQTSCRLRQRVRHGAPLGTLLRVLPGRAARSQSNSSRSGKDDRLIMRQALAAML